MDSHPSSHSSLYTFRSQGALLTLDSPEDQGLEPEPLPKPTLSQSTLPIIDKNVLLVNGSMPILHSMNWSLH